jgi:glycine/sarcosine N-methyltransferase
VLDVGCGTGHYSGRFAGDGCDALGIDLDPDMIAAARQRYPGASFIPMDMRDVRALKGTFDLAFCIGNVAPHIDRNAFGGVVSEVGRMLDPGGRWVLQTVNWDFVLRHHTYAFRPKELNEGRLRFLREYRDITESGVRFLTRLVADNRTLFEGEHKLFPVRAAEYVALHADSGFELLEHLADFQGTAFDPSGDSGSVFVFRKHSM